RSFFFLSTSPATTELYTLSLHDALPIYIIITGSQKALAMPPGLALISVSQKALDRAASQQNRGYYFDLLEFLDNHQKGMTPSTPDRKSTRLNSSHVKISYAVFCLKKKIK